MVPLFVSVEPNPDIVTALLAPDIDSVTPLLIVMRQLKPPSEIGVELLLETVTGQLTIADACPETKFRHRIGKITLSFNFNLTQFPSRFVLVYIVFLTINWSNTLLAN